MAWNVFCDFSVPNFVNMGEQIKYRAADVFCVWRLQPGIVLDTTMETTEVATGHGRSKDPPHQKIISNEKNHMNSENNTDTKKMPGVWPLQPEDPDEQSCGSMAAAPGANPAQASYDNGTHVQPEMMNGEILELHTCGRHFAQQKLSCWRVETG